MSLDGKLLARAKTRLDERRRKNEEALERNRSLAYEKRPRIREIDRRIRETMIEVIGVALQKREDPTETLDKLRIENLDLQEERALELAKAGLPVDLLSEKYYCPRCHDTGYDGTKLCSCLMELYREEQTRELSGLLKLGEDTFDNFDLTLYDDRRDPNTGASPREIMATVYDACLNYARRFSKDSMNLFLSGAPGLGKTFLSTSIARVVSEAGFSVVYDTASSVFDLYRDAAFSKGDVEASRKEIRRMETCDLLILDDLGTELASAFVTSSLYTLLNTRITGGRKTVISSNLTMRDLSARYSPAVMSRLQGEFTVLRFAGRDIRQIKKR